MITKIQLIKKLNESKIVFQLHEHEALFTVTDSKQKREGMVGSHTKNLFLKNKKSEYFLFSCQENQSVDLKKLSKSLVLGNLSFAKEAALKEHLSITPGAVTPFGLLNDIENKVNYFLDNDLIQGDQINFHPLENTATITLQVKDFINFLLENKKKVNIFDFKSYTLIE